MRTLKKMSGIANVLFQRMLSDLKKPSVDRAIARAMQHISGPAPDTLKGPVIIQVLIRDGAPYLQPFLDHHRRLGVTDFIFVENGSADGTAERLMADPTLTVLKSDFSFSYSAEMRDWLARTYHNEAWVLVLDIDELLEFPGSETKKLPDLIAELEANGRDALICQMLDMYPDRLERGDDTGFGPEDYRNFEIASLETRRYPRNLFCSVPDGVTTMRGGVRARIFGTNTMTLSKGALYKPGRAKREGNHFLRKARFADRTAVLLHYKFLPSFFDRVEDAVRRQTYHNGSAEYKAYQRSLADSDGIDMRHETTLRYESPEQLVELGLLVWPKKP